MKKRGKAIESRILIKIILPTFIIFAVLVWLTAAHVISGWLMYLLWVLGFVCANFWVTKVTAKRSYHRLKKQGGGSQTA
ncbi:MAG: hypothetical protein ACLSH6_03370 [Limosilactobacillus pontis]